MATTEGGSGQHEHTATNMSLRGNTNGVEFHSRPFHMSEQIISSVFLVKFSLARDFLSRVKRSFVDPKIFPLHFNLN